MAVDVQINDKVLSAEPGRSLFECAAELGISIPTSCQNHGKCRECLIEVTGGSDLLTLPKDNENHLSDGLRLSCCSLVIGETGSVHCNTLKRGSIHIEDTAKNLPALESLPDLDPAVTRVGDQVYIDGEPIAKSTGPLLGAAIDVGTTTVVLRVYDLESSEMVAGASFENPQRFGGSDIMARIVFDTTDGTRLLQRTLLGHLTHVLNDLPIDPSHIYELVVVGNSTMRDLFFGLNVETIGQKPYRSITEHQLLEGTSQTTAVTTTAKRLRLPLHPKARVLGLPLIGSHVGADTAACLLAIGMQHEERTVALMDIGTNTEIVCGSRHRRMVASCPAGPAFEGGVISCGVPGLDGAIESVRINGTGLRYSVIGGGKPIGICGSGLVDALSTLLENDLIDRYGRYTDDSDAYVIDPQHRIEITEADISELAQAKGANMAGLHILLKTYGVDLEGLDQLYLAGGFAGHIDLDSARRIGLIPNLPDEKITVVGNAAIEGASLALRSVSQRRVLDSLVRDVAHVELEQDPYFFEHFVDACQYDYDNASTSANHQ